MQLDMPLPREFVTKAELYDYKTELPSLIGRIKEAGTIVVLKEGSYFGVVDDRELARSNITKMQKILVGKFANKVPLLNGSTTFENVLRYFYESDARALPFAEGNKVVGIVKREKLLQALLSLHLLSKAKTGDLMTSPVIGIDANASVAEAIATMQKNKINRLLIISDGKPAGIVTNGDIAFAFAKPAERLPQMKKETHALDGIYVGSVGQNYIDTIDYSSGVEEAIKQMLEKGVSALGVTRNGKLVGLITAREILKAAISGIGRSVPIYLAGLDEYAKDNEDSIRQELGKIAEKIGKFTKLNIDAVYVTLKSSKSVYEINARIKFERGNEIHASASEQTLDSTISELAERLYEMAKKQKEKMQTKKEGAERYYA